MLTTCVIKSYFWHRHLAQPPHPPGPPLWNIYVIMSLEPADTNKAMEIPVAEGVQETNPKYSDAEVWRPCF